MYPSPWQFFQFIYLISGNKVIMNFKWILQCWKVYLHVIPKETVSTTRIMKFESVWIKLKGSPATRDTVVCPNFRNLSHISDFQVCTSLHLKWLRCSHFLFLLSVLNSITLTLRPTLRAEPPFVFFFTEEEKSRLCSNRVNTLKLPQPELLD